MPLRVRRLHSSAETTTLGFPFRVIVCGEDWARTMTSDSTTNVRFNDFWGRWTKTGVHGDPTKASREKGRRIADAIMKEMLVWLDEFREWPIEGRQDQHRLPVQREIRW